MADQSGTGFIRIPELTWEHFDDAADVVHVGRQISAEVLDFDTTRGQVQLSLKALLEDRRGRRVWLDPAPTA